MQTFPIKTAGAPATSDFEEQLVKYFYRYKSTRRECRRAGGA